MAAPKRKTNKNFKKSIYIKNLHIKLQLKNSNKITQSRYVKFIKQQII